MNTDNLRLQSYDYQIGTNSNSCLFTPTLSLLFSIPFPTNTPLTLIPKQNPTIHILILPMPLPEQHSSVRQIQNVHCGRYHQQDENLPLTHTLLFPPGFASSSGWIATPCRKPLPKNTYASPISSNLTYTDSPTSSWSGTSHRS